MVGVGPPQEVQILLDMKARWPETWREKVQKIHLAKKTFGGLVTELRDPPAPPESRLCVRGPEAEWHLLQPREACTCRHTGED